MQETLRLLEKFVNHPSGSLEKHNTTAFARVAADEFRALGMDVREIAGDIYGPTVECTWGRGPKRLLLLGHLDTVFPQSESQPFTVDGDLLTGSGVTDMKGGVVVMMRALQRVLPTLDPGQCTITVMLNCDEELGSPESGPHILETAKQCFAALSFEPPESENGLIVARKGVTSFFLKCGGIRGHSGSAYERCASAIQELSERIAALYTLRDDAKSISLNIGCIGGGTAENVVADEAWAKGEFRYYDQNYQQPLIDRITEICKKPGVDGTTTELSFGAWHPALNKSDESMALFEVAKAFAKAQGRTVHPDAVGSAGDISIAGLAHIPVLDGFGIEGKSIHTTSETGNAAKIPLQIELAAKMIEHLMRA